MRDPLSLRVRWCVCDEWMHLELVIDVVLTGVGRHMEGKPVRVPGDRPAK